MISFHDGFLGANNWAGFLPGADRVALDLHNYLCFTTQSSSPMSARVTEPCSDWGSLMNTSMTAFGVTSAGEFSCAINDCGFYVNGVGLGTRYEGTYPGYTTAVGNCSSSDEWENWDDALKNSTKQFAMASMDSFGVSSFSLTRNKKKHVANPSQHWFFWSWKIGPRSDGLIRAPYWSYKLGYEQGWLPKDPREAVGQCGNSNPRTGSLAPSQTGGSGAGQIPASVSSQLAWPPTSISNAGAAVSLLPHYTRTGSVPTPAVPTFSATSSINAGNGWENSADTLGLAVPIATCSYPNPWMESGFTVPPACGTQSTGARRDVVGEVPLITAAPTPSR
jgi:glucan 1,3-beta-glucosidase